jgi:2-polyprenyl-6-methoxyphenol hydroxylase-like FAD-dependent oxidoreductase
VSVHEFLAAAPQGEHSVIDLSRKTYDVVIVGASIAGCISAIEFVKRGLRVAVLEKHSDKNKYKVMCSHIMHPNVAEELKSLGVYDALLAKGGQATGLEIHLSANQIISYPFNKKPAFANIERRLLDPVLKDVLTRFKLIDCFWGERVIELVKDAKGHVLAVKSQSREGRISRFEGTLIVGADGVGSTVARLDNCKDHVIDNGRVGIFAYFENPVRSSPTRILALNQGESFVGFIPNGDRVILNAYIPRSLYEQVKTDVPLFFQGFVIEALQARGFGVGDQLSELMVAKKTATSFRKGASPGLVLVGDARLSADVMTGIGCSWAIIAAKQMASSLSRPILAARRGTPVTKARLRASMAAYKLWFALRFHAYARLIGWSSTHVRPFLHPTIVRHVLALIRLIYPDNATATLPTFQGSARQSLEKTP